MLDERSRALLAAIVEGDDGGFKVVEEGELLMRCPAAAGALTSILSYLEENKLIELRYAEEGTYCIRALPAGRFYHEREERERRERGRTQRNALLLSALGAFLGAFLGGLLVFLVSFL